MAKKYKGNLDSLTYLKRHQNFRKFNKRAGIFHDHLPSVAQYFDGDDVRGLWVWIGLFVLFTTNEFFHLGNTELASSSSTSGTPKGEWDLFEREISGNPRAMSAVSISITVPKDAVSVIIQIWSILTNAYGPNVAPQVAHPLNCVWFVGQHKWEM